MPELATASDGAQVLEKNGAIGAAIEKLTGLFKDRCSTSMALREQHGHTTTWLKNQRPMQLSLRRRPRKLPKPSRFAQLTRFP